MMKILTTLSLSILLALGLGAPALASDGAPLTEQGIFADVATAGEDARQDRAAVRALLEDETVRGLAASQGLDILDAEAAVATLSDEEARELARMSRDVQSQLAGGDRIVIGTTTLIIILLVLLILVAD